MVKPAGKRENLVGKLLLSSALVAVSLAYGWWQRTDAENLRVAMAPAPLPIVPKKPIFIPTGPVTLRAAPAASADQAETAAADEAGSDTKAAPNQIAAEPQNPVVAKAAPRVDSPSVMSVAPAPLPQSTPVSIPPATPTPLPPVSADGDAPSLFLVTGTPDPTAKSPTPAGTHLEDGDYVSSRHQFMWGDLRIKIFVRGGVITGVQALQFPDHRSQSLYLSGLALPKLESEVIKNQTAQVDTVSSATDTSIVFQDAVADAIVKATRG
jgi:uncharacterized protein with FMN-binding domain